MQKSSAEQVELLTLKGRTQYRIEKGEPQVKLCTRR